VTAAASLPAAVGVRWDDPRLPSAEACDHPERNAAAARLPAEPETAAGEGAGCLPDASTALTGRSGMLTYRPVPSDNDGLALGQAVVAGRTARRN
jgi:hypothetical protein